MLPDVSEVAELQEANKARWWPRFLSLLGFAEKILIFPG